MLLICSAISVVINTHSMISNASLRPSLVMRGILSVLGSTTRARTLGTLRQSCHSFLLQLAGVDDLGVEVGLWDGQLQHIRRLHIRHHIVKVAINSGEIKKFSKKGLGESPRPPGENVGGGSLSLGALLLSVEKDHPLPTFEILIFLSPVQFPITLFYYRVEGLERTK